MTIQTYIRIVSLLVVNIIMLNAKENYQNEIKFVFFTERNESELQSSSSDGIGNIAKCKVGVNEKIKLAIIVHGWMESCRTPWVTNLMQNLKIYRQGCIMCMDYSKYSMNSNYYSLVRDFNGIANVLTEKLKELHRIPMDPSDMYMFGFSFGGHLTLESGRRFSKIEKRLIKQIDVCDAAGPGFDNNIIYSRHSPRYSAQNVQCIHTSSDKGTRKRDCHQNWNMGNCGNSQIAAGPKPLGSHGLCPYFYNNAFQHHFFAIPKPNNCRSNRNSFEIEFANFSMGYLDALKYEGRFPNGKDFFANTFTKHPYNKELDRDNQV